MVRRVPQMRILTRSNNAEDRPGQMLAVAPLDLPVLANVDPVLGCPVVLERQPAGQQGNHHRAFANRKQPVPGRSDGSGPRCCAPGKRLANMRTSDVRLHCR